MANKGWDSTSNGPGMSSTARTSGRQTDTSIMEPFTRGSRLADPGQHNDPLDQRSDLHEEPGNLAGS